MAVLWYYGFVDMWVPIAENLLHQEHLLFKSVLNTFATSPNAEHNRLELGKATSKLAYIDANATEVQ